MKSGSPFGSKQNERRKHKRLLQENRKRKRLLQEKRRKREKSERDYKVLCLKLREEARKKAEAERCLSPPPRGLYVIKTICRDGSLTQGGRAELPCYQDMVNLLTSRQHQWSSNIIVRDPTCTDVLKVTTPVPMSRPINMSFQEILLSSKLKEAFLGWQAVAAGARVESECLAFAERLHNELYAVYGDRMFPWRGQRSFDIKLNSLGDRAKVSVQTGITKRKGVCGINKNKRGKVVVIQHSHSELIPLKDSFKRTEIHGGTGALVEHLEELLHEYTEPPSLCELFDNTTLSEGVWKITYTYKNRDREIITKTATWLLKEYRRGFAVERMCTDGKFRQKPWDAELVEYEDGKYFMLDTGVGDIEVINYQHV